MFFVYVNVVMPPVTSGVAAPEPLAVPVQDTVNASVFSSIVGAVTVMLTIPGVASWIILATATVTLTCDVLMLITADSPWNIGVPSLRTRI